MECEKLSMDGDENRFGRFSVQKQKDGEDDIAFGYRMEKIGLSDIDPDATSLVVVPVDADALPAKKSQPQGREDGLAVKIAIETFEDAVAQNAGFKYTMNDYTPGIVTAVVEDVWWERFKVRYPETSSKEIQYDSVRTAFSRATKHLLKKKRFGHHNKKWWQNSFD